MLNLTNRSNSRRGSSASFNIVPFLSTPIQNSVDLKPGVYVIDSSTGIFDITLEAGVQGQWEFQTPYNSIETNNVTFPAGSNITFTDENGNVVQGDLCIDTLGTEVLITNHDGSDNYIVSVLGGISMEEVVTPTATATVTEDLLVGQLFFDTSNTPHPSKRFAGETYPWANDPILKAQYDANNHDFITDNGDDTYTVVPHTDFIRAGITNIGQHVDDTTAVNGLAGTVLTSGLQGTNRRTGGTANAIRTTQSRGVTFTGDAETAPDYRAAYFGIYGDLHINVAGNGGVTSVVSEDLNNIIIEGSDDLAYLRVSPVCSDFTGTGGFTSNNGNANANSSTLIGEFTPSITGEYQVTHSVVNISGTAGIGIHNAPLAANNTANTVVSNSIFTSSADRVTATAPSKTYSVNFTAGQTYYVYGFSGGGSSTSSHSVSIPDVICETGLISLDANNQLTAGSDGGLFVGNVTPKLFIPMGDDFATQGGNSGTLTEIVTFSRAPLKDNYNSWNGIDTYTIPQDGDYYFDFNGTWINNSGTSNDRLELTILKNNNPYVAVGHDVSNILGATNTLIQGVSSMLPDLVAGDTISLSIRGASAVIIIEGDKSYLSLYKLPD